MRKLVLCNVLALAVVFFGCSSKKDPVSELEKAANAMAQTEPAAASAPAPAEPVPAQEPAAQPQPAQPSQPPAQEIKQALVAYKAGKLTDAVTRLHNLRSTAVMSPQQRVALQDSIAAVMGEVYALAEKGDASAIAAVKQYEQMNTQPH